MSAGTQKARYTFGASMVPPFDVYLLINAERVTIEQLRKDVPMLIVELERYMVNTRFNMEKQGLAEGVTA